MTWREHITLLHVPTTSVLLSLAVLGSLFAQEIYVDRLAVFLVQIFIGSAAANHFDEVVNRPWHTKMPTSQLWVAAVTGLLFFIMLGVYLALKVSYSFIFFVIAESFFVVAYDLELFGGIFHNAATLGISWTLVFLAGYYLQDQIVSPLLLTISLIICFCSIEGITLYEKGKSFGKDGGCADPEARFAWEKLRTCILVMNVITLITAVYRFFILQN